MNSPGRGVTYCEVGDRLVFLDAEADRYFCLHPQAEAEFRAIAGSPLDPETQSCRLAAAGLFTGGPETPPAACAAAPTIGRSLLDRPPDLAGTTETLAAAAHLQAARLRFNLQGFAGALASLAGTKRRSTARPASADELASALAGFVAAERMLSVRDRCLSHSWAIARRLLVRGIDANLVLGVRLGPFAAHCWVQHADWVVNDRLDIVRTFTPILVL